MSASHPFFLHAVLRLKCVLLSLFLLLSFQPKSRGVLFFTDRDAFLAQLPYGYYLEDFSGFASGTIPAPLVLENDPYRYTVQIYNELGVESTLAASNFDGSMSIGSRSGYNYVIARFSGSEGSGNIFAFGAYVYGTDWRGDLYPYTDVTFQLSSGETHTISNINNTTTFLGVISDDPLAYLRINASLLDYLQFKEMIVGTVIPEPSTYAIMATGLGLLLLAKRRRVSGKVLQQ